MPLLVVLVVGATSSLTGDSILLPPFRCCHPAPPSYELYLAVLITPCVISVLHLATHIASHSHSRNARRNVRR